MLSRFDKVAVRSGALGVLMFVLPAYVLVKALAGNNGESKAWLVFLAALIFGSAFGGYVGARENPPTPIAHGALSAFCGLGLTLVLALALQLVQGDLDLTAALIALVILYFGVAFGCLGGLLAAKGYRPPR